MLHPDDIAFLCITENPRLAREAILMIQSLRKYGGRLSNASVFSFEPRTDKITISSETALAFKKLEVQHIAKNLNTYFPQNGFANKPAVCAYAEQHIEKDVLVFLDSDLVFFNEPSELLKGDFYEASIRPVHGKNCGVISPEEPDWKFWIDLFSISGVTSPRVIRPCYHSVNILSYYNSGFVAVQRNKGIFKKWEHDYKIAIDKNIKPVTQKQVYIEQASLSVVIEALAKRMYVLPRSYNYPFCGHNNLPYSEKLCRFDEIVALHHHHALDYWLEHFAGLVDFYYNGERAEWLINTLLEMNFSPARNFDISSGKLTSDSAIKMIESKHFKKAVCAANCRR